MKTDKCVNCGVEVVCDIPFIAGKYKGFKSAPHGCPEEFTQYTVKAKDLGMTEDEVAQLFAAVSAQERAP